MTLIECFTESHIDNIAACLRLRPEKVIMLGDRQEMEAPVKRYQTLVKQRGWATEISMCDVDGKNFSQMCAALTTLVREEPDCIIDLTGGEEPVIMAVGAVLATQAGQQKSLRVERFDQETGMVVDCVNGGRTKPEDTGSLTVEELIAIHGGVMLPGSYQPPQKHTVRELKGLWRMASESPKEWNRAITLLNEFESRADSKTQVYLPLRYISGSIPNFEQKENTVRELLGKLYRYGVIDDESNGFALEYTYRSELMRLCTEKAGNVLEVKTLLEARAVSPQGEPFFRDCRMSVSIDWDSVIHDPLERVPETRNEIDVVAIHGMTPLFISCKNGSIGEEELYKLSSVARRFGGPYAKKMLIATDLDQKSYASNRAFIQRASDMGIYLVTDAGELLPEEWPQIFLEAMK